MAQAAFKKGRTNRKRCKAMKRDGTLCGMLANGQIAWVFPS
jgi:hypothetical protein